MAKLTYAEKLSFATSVVQFLSDNKDSLKETGFDVAKRLSELDQAVKESVKLDSEQEQLKAKLTQATEKAVTSLNNAYTKASSAVDAMVGVMGKETELAKRLRKIRQQMTKGELRGKREAEETK
jgi:hypothetical protein